MVICSSNEGPEAGGTKFNSALYKIKTTFFSWEKHKERFQGLWDPQGAMDKINMYIHEPHREM
jgi:hypothetical protein